MQSALAFAGPHRHPGRWSQCGTTVLMSTLIAPSVSSTRHPRARQRRERCILRFIAHTGKNPDVCSALYICIAPTRCGLPCGYALMEMGLAGGHGALLYWRVSTPRMP